jgi:hypothetical protein
MANTMTLIASSTVGAGGASAVTFSSIPQTYTDLQIYATGRVSTTPLSDLIVKFNGSSTGYTQKYIIGTGSSAVSGSQTYGQIGVMGGSLTTANTFSTNSTYIPNYTSSNYKSFSSDDAYENNATQAYSSFWANLWSNTAAITSLEISCTSGLTMVQYSSFYLYGIKNS